MSLMKLQSNCWPGLLSSEDVNGAGGPILNMVSSHGYGLEASVPQWLLSGLSFLLHRPLHRAACFCPRVSNLRVSRSYNVFYEIPPEVTYYPFCCILLNPPTNRDTVWEVMTQGSNLEGGDHWVTGKASHHPYLRIGKLP